MFCFRSAATLSQVNTGTVTELVINGQARNAHVGEVHTCAQSQHLLTIVVELFDQA